jgi:hypothetical protein
MPPQGLRCRSSHVVIRLISQTSIWSLRAAYAPRLDGRALGLQATPARSLISTAVIGFETLFPHLAAPARSSACSIVSRQHAKTTAGAAARTQHGWCWRGAAQLGMAPAQNLRASQRYMRRSANAVSGCTWVNSPWCHLLLCQLAYICNG